MTIYYFFVDAEDRIHFGKIELSEFECPDGQIIDNDFFFHVLRMETRNKIENGKKFFYFSTSVADIGHSLGWYVATYANERTDHRTL